VAGPPGEPFPININLIPVKDGTPSEGEIRVAVEGLSNGRAGSASGMHAEDVKAWLHGIKLEEDPEIGPANTGAGDNWRRFNLEEPIRLPSPHWINVSVSACMRYGCVRVLIL
jgi:hypothetical protein